MDYPDSNKPCVLYTDASDSRLCLTQECDGDEKPIYYLSHKLSKSQYKWPEVEKEAFAIHFALQKLDYYLHSRQFVIRTDHKPSNYFLDSPMQNKKIQLWALRVAMTMPYMYCMFLLALKQIISYEIFSCIAGNVINS